MAPANDEPVANDATANGNEDDAQIAITLTGADLEGPVASFRLRSCPPTACSTPMRWLRRSLRPAWDYAAAGNALTLYFVPVADWNGSTSFQFAATDGGGMSDVTPATATINVAPADDEPTANKSVGNGNEDESADRDHPHRRRRGGPDRELPPGESAGEWLFSTPMCC